MSRILVIDDDLDVAQSLVALLRDMEHVVDFAVSGRAAFRLARSFVPQIALLDIGLPDADGWTLARALRLEPGLQSLRVFAITGRPSEDDRRRAVAAGCEAYLPKPLDLDHVTSLINLSSRPRTQHG